MKRLFIAVIIIIILIAALASAAFMWRNALAKMLLTRGIKETTGLNVMIEEIDVSFVPSTIRLRNIILFNPEFYDERIMADIPELFLDYNLHAILRGNLHFRKMNLDVRRLGIIKDKHGRVNVDYLKKAKKEDEAAARESIRKDAGATVMEEKQAKPQNFKIDRLELKLGKITYKDLNPTALVGDLEIDLYTHDVFKNVTSPKEVVRIVLAKAVAKTVIKELAELDIAPVTGERDMADVFKKGMKRALDAVFEKFSDKIKLPQSGK